MHQQIKEYLNMNYMYVCLSPYLLAVAPFCSFSKRCWLRSCIASGVPVKPVTLIQGGMPAGRRPKLPLAVPGAGGPSNSCNPADAVKAPRLVVAAVARGGIANRFLTSGELIVVRCGRAPPEVGSSQHRLEPRLQQLYR